jgi:hypothetical protein
MVSWILGLLGNKTFVKTPSLLRLIDKFPSYLFQSHLRVVLPTFPAIARSQGMAKLERVCMDFLWAKMVKGETKWRERHEFPNVLFTQLTKE